MVSSKRLGSWAVVWALCLGGVAQAQGVEAENERLRAEAELLREQLHEQLEQFNRDLERWDAERRRLEAELTQLRQELQEARDALRDAESGEPAPPRIPAELRPSYLDNPVTLNFPDTPLADVVMFLGDITGGSFLIDATLDPDEVISVRLRDVSLEDAIQLMCLSHGGIDYEWRDESIVFVPIAAEDD